MNSAKELIVQQQEEAIQELTRTIANLTRLRELVQSQGSYSPEALEESVKALLEHLSHVGRRFSAHIAILIALRCRRVIGVQYE